MKQEGCEVAGLLGQRHLEVAAESIDLGIDDRKGIKASNNILGEQHSECIYLGPCNRSQAIGCHLASSWRRQGSTKWWGHRPWWWCFCWQASRQGHWPCLGSGEEWVWHWWCASVWCQPDHLGRYPYIRSPLASEVKCRWGLPEIQTAT